MPERRSRVARPRLRPVGLAAAFLVLAGCSDAGRDVPDWRDAQRRILDFYDDNAYERGGTCLPVRMRGITATRTLVSTVDRLTLSVRYGWDSDGGGATEGASSACSGFGERQFVLAPRTGGGWSVVSMNGPRR